MREQELISRDHPIKCAAKLTESANVSTSARDVGSHTKRRIAIFYILVRLHQIGEHQRKRKMEDLEREKEVGELAEMTEVKQEVVIDGVSHPKMIGDKSPHTNLETELTEYREEIEDL